MSKPTGYIARTATLVRVALGSRLVRDAARFFVTGCLAAAAGLGAAWMAGALLVHETRALPTGGPGAAEIPGSAIGSAPAAAFIPALTGVLAAALIAGAACVMSVRRLRREQAIEFARAARRLGQEKTTLAELRTACRRLGSAVERSITEVVYEDDSRDTWSAGPSLALDSPARSRDHRLAERLKRIARAAVFFGGADLELKKLALAGPCAEVIEQYRRQAGPEREILYAEDGGGDWLAAPLDRPLFVLAIRELLDNVFEHGGDWDRITVTTEPIPGAILLRIRDDGVGLDPETLAEITSGRPSAQGGLGLFVARAVVEAHGGQFKLESHPGQGTSVSLKFPTHA